MSKDDAFVSAMDRLKARIAQAQASASRPESLSAYAPASGSPAREMAEERVGQLVEGLNPQQRQAVMHTGGHMLVVAGAGSGKTRVLTTRIAYLIATGHVRPSEVLAITFTNKAAKEMRERLESLLGPTAVRMWISTFHSACVRILRTEHQALGMRSSFTIYDAADSARLMKIVAQEENIDIKAFPPKTLSRKVSDLKNAMVTVGQAKEQAVDRDDQMIADAYAGYQRRLRAANAVDFDDLIMLTVGLLRDNPAIAEHYRRRFRHVLVDEYQDTNTAQYQLVRELIGDESDPLHGELTVVGDADQSIYAFRGATIRNIEDFEQDFPNATTVLLEQNYRSTQNILTAANSLIANNQGRRPKKLWTAAGDGAKLVGYVADAESDESAFVVEEIDNVRTKHGYKYGDIAVFYRANAQSRSIEEMFVRSGIPYKVVGGTRFYERKEIKDALAYLHAVANPDDTVSIRRVLNEPKRGLGAKAEGAVALHAEKYQMSFGQALTDVAYPQLAVEQGRSEVVGIQARARNAMAAFVQMLEKAREQADSGESPADILDVVMDASGYLAALQESKDPQDEVRVENLAELHAVASDFRVRNEEGTLAEFLDQISLVADSDQIPDEDDNNEGEVVLMTIHTAKGLEFPVVFATGFEDGTFPHIRSLSSPTELAEERRLAYVALTRARERLYITRAATRSQWGAPQELPRSRFLDEIPAEIIEWRREESAMDTVRHASWGSARNSWGAKRNSWSSNDDDFAPVIGSGNGKFTPGKILGDDPAPVVEQELADAPATDGLTTGGIAVGDRVRHGKFGVGKVLSFEGTGKSTVAKVRFESGAEKRLMLRFAPLEKI
ncbi:DNA helicase PcrA [Arcanobacterium phocisimile]|uniref:ATP-dependent DNA helicase n=1 Tax=Arcanobacterium phocisimile TaxID=1302235 RepID=A0ABX7IFD7_9ACTO|nr:DNA helicase PcrA [Arcanobacterium phocisimile]QRV01747.1 DNA helicase PcrA [Arcanobacterium phocisimile]